MGGSNGNALSSVEVTNIGNGPSCPGSNLPEAIYGHSATYSRNGIFVCGGRTNIRQKTNQCHRLGSNMQWIPFPALNIKRDGFTMDEVNGILVAIGGLSGGQSLEYINLIDDNEWTTKQLGFSIRRHCSVPISEKEIMVIGGDLNDQVTLKKKLKL